MLKGVGTHKKKWYEMSTFEEFAGHSNFSEVNIGSHRRWTIELPIPTPRREGGKGYRCEEALSRIAEGRLREIVWPGGNFRERYHAILVRVLRGRRVCVRENVRERERERDRVKERE